MVDGRDDNGGERDGGAGPNDEAGPDELGAAVPLAAAERGPAGRAARTWEAGWRPRAPRSGWWLVVVPIVLIGLALVPVRLRAEEDAAGPGRDQLRRRAVRGVRFQRMVQPGSNLFFNGFFDSCTCTPPTR